MQSPGPADTMRAQIFGTVALHRVLRQADFTAGVRLRLIGFYWGILGVTGLIASAVFRLSPRIAELDPTTFTLSHWAVLLLFTPYMAYAEGYKGFHLNFAPRVVARALVLRDARIGLGDAALPGPGRHLLLCVLAPLFCMGFIHATRRRMLTSVLVTSAIVLVVLLVSHAPQPWRGIIDVGVVTGLVIGIASLVWHWLRFELATVRPPISVDLP